MTALTMSGIHGLPTSGVPLLSFMGDRLRHLLPSYFSLPNRKI